MSYEKLNTFGKTRTPFLFISDFKGEKLEVFPLDQLDENDIEFNIEENYILKKHPHKIDKIEIPFSDYQKKFDRVIKKIESGETYILNLTQETKIKTTLNLKEIYSIANAHYKLRFKDKFVCFSPEKFIQIEGTTIHTFPMKGTIDATLSNANMRLLEDKKEMAEHIMIVDLLRNDLSMVSNSVAVIDFRYITRVQAGVKDLLQVSSHITGSLDENWHEHIGDILKALLPAGSISGAPKKSTLKIIDDIESYDRGFFSGVFGVYNGNTLDSGVMIRFIEKKDTGFVYKSGGGITLDSDPYLEYQELLEKIYLP